jgi:hypothetical protein
MKVLEMCIEEVGQFLSPRLCGDASVVLTVIVQAHGSCCHYLCPLEKVRISIDIFEHLAHREAYLRKEITSENLITSVGMEVTTS